MGIFNRSKVPSADAVRLQGENHTTGYTFTAQINDLNAELREARAQIAAKDAALDALDEAHQITQQNLWRDITELRASLAGKEQEHQDFRLQNDAEWRAKLDHLKAQIAAKDAALTRIVNECSRFPIKDGLAFRVESIALNGLAAKLMARTAPEQEKNDE